MRRASRRPLLTPLSCACGAPPIGACSSCAAPRCGLHLASCEVTHDEATCAAEFAPRWDAQARHRCDRQRGHAGDHHGMERDWFRSAAPIRLAS